MRPTMRTKRVPLTKKKSNDSDDDDEDPLLLKSPPEILATMPTLLKSPPKTLLEHNNAGRWLELCEVIPPKK